MNQKPASGITPGKIGLIVVLAVVLLAVLGAPFLRGGSAPTPLKLEELLAKRRSSSEHPKGDTGSASGAGSALDRNPRRWVTISRDEAQRHDPFSLPEGLGLIDSDEESLGVATSQEDSETIRRLEQDRLLAAMQSQGVGMIMSTPEGMMATIGSTTIRVGDLIRGLRVAEITPAGVVLVEERTRRPDPKK
ncbi:MAG: hypothetical protein ACC645_04645 [Pirellulales bacterium]